MLGNLVQCMLVQILVVTKDTNKRLCVDYRILNSMTQKDSYPLPNISDIFDKFYGTCYFSCLDL